ncbi:hypothetical protein CW751_11185 [Brumimicrobium salinarum]|uniref:Uncharacterized protein n=1 Tax=Brumimicrobium salinarum TaxID=2058658 RepID=A0A2I0R0W0_9FLAO|nr:hypothetical protein [Brumimicrobium salinarum]PKR80218.1 hypothetical protein CW751_11185 [Brumimicrobium salinarum]
MSNRPVLLWTTRLLNVGIIGIVVVFYLQTIPSDNLLDNPYLQEVSTIQRDFEQNKLYTGYRYSLGIEDYTPMGMIKAAPISLITAFYRPFVWEANSAFLLVSGLEGLLLVFFTFTFFFNSGNLLQHFKFIRKQEFLVYALLFSLVLGFFVGYTSGLFNVLVRFKAPYMSLLFLFFSAKANIDMKYTAATNDRNTYLDSQVKR